MQSRSGLNLFPCDDWNIEAFLIQCRGLYIDIFLGVVFSVDAESFAIAESQAHVSIKRAADHVVAARWIHRVKAHRSKQKPC